MALSAAIVLAAGEGTRMRSNKPKVLHTFAGKTFLNRVMDSVTALTPDTLAVVVHFQAERVAEAQNSRTETGKCGQKGTGEKNGSNGTDRSRSEGTRKTEGCSTPGQGTDRLYQAERASRLQEPSL